VPAVFLLFALLGVFSGLALLIDLLVGAGLILALGRAVPLALRGTLVTGHVAAVERRRPGRSARVRVAYQTAAGKHDTFGTTQSPWIGAPKAVRYDPARPGRATTMVAPARTAAAGITAVLVVAALSAGMLTGSIWYFAGVHSDAQLPLAGGCFFGALALATGYFAAGRFAQLLRWRRLLHATGQVKRFDEHAPGGPGILVSFTSEGGHEEFWARAGSVLARVGDTVAVRYDAAKPATSATVQSAAQIRTQAIGSAIVALVFAVVAIAALVSI
jgi:hypothetical protein